jgi:outer membrane protein assembly factor BamD (BamD/ComL family)
MGKKPIGMSGHRNFFFICILTTSVLICGCSGGFQAKSSFKEANDFFNQGSYQASLNKYEQIIENHPAAGDRALFEMGIIYAHPQNGQKDYQKALECFQRLVKDYPGSGYRQDSEMMVFYINNIAIKDKLVATQQTQIETLRQEVKSKDNEITTLRNEIVTLQKKIEALEQKIFAYAMQQGPADKILI